MATLNSTTLARALGETERSVYLTSASTVEVGHTLVVEREAMLVQTLVGTRAEVLRGTGGSRVAAHASGVTVYTGPSTSFYQSDPGAGSAPADPIVTPWINLTTGDVFTVVSGAWVKSNEQLVDVSADVTGTLAVAQGGTGATTLAGAKIPTAGVAAYAKTTTGVQTLLAGASGARNILLLVTVSAVFADGSGAQPTFKIGETDADDSFAATTVFTNAALGTSFVFSGALTSTKALIVTATAATGTATGALRVHYLVVPAA